MLSKFYAERDFKNNYNISDKNKERGVILQYGQNQKNFKSAVEEYPFVD